MLSALLKDFDRGEREFEAALRFNRRMGAGPASVRTQFEYARMLVARAALDGHALERERELLADARSSAVAFQMKTLLSEIAAFEQAIEAPIDRQRSPNNTAHLRCEGDVWYIEWRGNSARIRTMKGFAAIAALLSCPNQDIHVTDLAATMDGQMQSSARQNHADLTNAGPVLDVQAKKAYRERIGELRAELDEAESLNDAALFDRLSSELGFLEHQLVQAIGLGGRDRPVGSSIERIRVRVTNAIRAAITRIAENHATLGRHLDVSIRTGTLCSYRPDPSGPLSWQL